ncbi:DUF2384 domain-containing protein [Candidatus Fermentibacteria bacterium]|nr:DUF2384 domain-containing protein [Candidatus Fermentibacteria bacterium]
MPRSRTRDTAVTTSPEEIARVREPGSVYGWTQYGFATVDASALRLRGRSRRPPCSALGLRLASSARAIEEIKRGFMFTAFEKLCSELQLTVYELADLVSIARRTLARRKQEGRLRALESEKVYRIATLFDSAVAALGGEEQARQWLKSPKKALRGQTPLQHADTEVGAREVEDLLGRLEHGVFS